jgi:hypothetical protein
MNSIISYLTFTIPSLLFKQLYFLSPPFSFSISLSFLFFPQVLVFFLLSQPGLLHRPCVPRIAERISNPAAEVCPPELRRPHRHRSLHPKPNQTAPIESQQSNHCIEDRSSGFTKIIASKPPSNTHKKVHINVWVFNSTIEAHSKKRRQPRPLSSGRSGGRWRRATNQKTTSSPPFIAPKTKSNRSNRIPTIQSLHRRSLFWVHKDHSFKKPHRIHTKKFT